MIFSYMISNFELLGQGFGRVQLGFKSSIYDTFLKYIWSRNHKLVPGLYFSENTWPFKTKYI